MGMTLQHDQIWVPGTPVPQGSAKGYVVKGHAVITHDNEQTMPWRSHVAALLRAAVGPRIIYPRPVPVRVSLQFVMPRRAAEPKRQTPAHTRKPDVDKLARAVLDAATGILYEDDSQVVSVDVNKRTAEIGEEPGLLLTWRRDLGHLERPRVFADVPFEPPRRHYPVGN